MKRLFLLLLIGFAFHFSNAQVSVANAMEDIIYVGIPNPISVTAFNYPCQSVILKVDTGMLEQVKNKCGYYNYIAPKHTHSVTFKIYAKTKSGLKLIDTSVFRIRPLPNPYAYLGGKHDGTISINVLKAQIAITANFVDFVYSDIKFRIDSFCYAIIRNNKIIYWGKNTGEIFERKTKDDIAKINVGDIISFYNIYYHNSMGESVNLEPFELSITN